MHTSPRIVTRVAPLAFALIAMIGCAPGSTNDNAAAGERGGQEEFGPYEVVENWPQPLPDSRHAHAGWTWGSTGAVFAESPDRIWIAQRGELPLPEGAAPWTPYGMLTPTRGNATGNTDGLSATCDTTAKRGWERRWAHSVIIVDRNGKLVDEWPHLDSLFGILPCGRGPHRITMNPYDPEKHVWIIDDQLHVIYRFTYDGKLEKTLGQRGVRGRGPNTFDRPTDIDWLPDGTYFISDGYGGTRVAKYDKTDTFLLEWGGPPKDPKNPAANEWNTVHSVAVSKDRRVFVVDRGHHRIQVFDENGKFLDMWSTGMRSLPYDHIITDDQKLWIIDGGTDRVVKYDLDGNFLYGWGSTGGLPGQFKGGHNMAVDQEGNLYVAEVFNGRVQKFRPKANADPAKVVRSELRHPDLVKVSAAPLLENEYVRVTQDGTRCASPSVSSLCGDRVIVALGDVEVVAGGKAQKLTRGQVAAFGPSESYDPPKAGKYFEVAFKPNHPPVISPRELIPPDKNTTIYDGNEFFVFEEHLEVGDTRARHGHSQRVVVQLNKTKLEQWPDGEEKVIRDIEPDRAGFNQAVIHTVKNIGELPLRGIVIEFKPRRAIAQAGSAVRR